LTSGPRRKSASWHANALSSGHRQAIPDQVRATFWKAADDVDSAIQGFAEDIFRVAVAHHEKIDELLVLNSRHWRLERMPAVDRNLLRMAVAE